MQSLAAQQDPSASLSFCKSREGQQGKGPPAVPVALHSIAWWEGHWVRLQIMTHYFHFSDSHAAVASMPTR